MSAATGEPAILVEDLDGVRTITLNRPQALNAFDRQLRAELHEALRAAERDSSVRVLVLTGSGRAFSVGQDLRDLESSRGADGRVRFDELLRRSYNPIIKRLAESEKPIMAAVNGVAAGAGLSLALACDLRLASQAATFVTAFSSIGLVPDSGALYFLPRLVGRPKAYELLLSSDRVSADDAHRLGLVNQVLPSEDFQAAVQQYATRLAQGPGLVNALTKRGLARAETAQLDEVLELEAQYQEIAGRSDDFREGVEAFLAKRSPRFQGR
jgi:2-(1,2-epoxy-1,2-dihydrophenyl)acetyl-CoA isomerase